MIDMTGIEFTNGSGFGRIVVVQVEDDRNKREQTISIGLNGWHVVGERDTTHPTQWDAICYVVERWRRWDEEDAEAAALMARVDKTLGK